MTNIGEQEGRSALWISLRNLSNGRGIYDDQVATQLSPELRAYWGIDLKERNRKSLIGQVKENLQPLVRSLEIPKGRRLSIEQVRLIVEVGFSLYGGGDLTFEDREDRTKRWKWLERTHNISESTCRRAFGEKAEYEGALDQLEILIRANPPKFPLHLPESPKPPSIQEGTLSRSRLAFLRNRVFLGCVAFVVLAVLVIGIAVIIRDVRTGRGEEAKQAPITITGPGGKTSQIPATRPPVTKAELAVKVDTNPNHLGSETLRAYYGSHEDWMIPKGKVVTGDPSDASKEQDYFYRFAKSLGGVAVGDLYFKATIQNLTGGAVYLSSMNVTELHCKAPLRGTQINSSGGAEGQPPRIVYIDLDRPRPRPVHVTKLLATLKFSKSDVRDFGFKLAKDETESFDIVSVTTKRSCEFKLEIEATINGKNEQIVLDDAGEPFRITPYLGDNFWMYGTSEGWVRVTPGAQPDFEKPVRFDQPLPETHP